MEWRRLAMFERAARARPRVTRSTVQAIQRAAGGDVAVGRRHMGNIEATTRESGNVRDERGDLVRRIFRPLVIDRRSVLPERKWHASSRDPVVDGGGADPLQR